MMKPCPFCGHDESSTTEGQGGAIVKSISVHCYDCMFWVGCDNCASNGPTKDGPEDAVKAWNERQSYFYEFEKNLP